MVKDGSAARERGAPAAARGCPLVAVEGIAGRPEPKAEGRSWSGARMCIWNLIHKMQSHSDYSCKEEFEHKVIFPSHFYNVEINLILKIPELLSTLLHLPELSQLVQFKFYLGLPVNPMSESHQQFSVHAEYLSGPKLQWTNWYLTCCTLCIVSSRYWS